MEELLEQFVVGEAECKMAPDINKKIKGLFQNTNGKQDGWGLQQPGLVAAVLAHGRGLE